MKVSLLWLKEFVDLPLKPEQVGDLLCRLGFDLISITPCGGGLRQVVTARVESVDKHPNADKLRLCRVHDGQNRWNVVCGAPNVAAGQTVPFARLGAVLPGGQKIEKVTLRGQESFGMICSERELALGDSHAGILVLPADTPVGRDVTSLLHMNDVLLDVEVTPNRPDALSHWGLARELAAALNKKLRFPKTRLPKARKNAGLVKIDEPRLCPRYIGRALEDVRVAPSPLWMRLRLERCGIRSINNIVDITNYVLLELGHPLHAFDLSRLTGERVVIRRARAGETLECLDEETRSLDSDSLVIADARRAVALAGIIGGHPSAVESSTRRILLESAYFQPSGIRRTRKALNVSTESSYRFERGTDPRMAQWASQRAAHLILAEAGGTLTAECDAWKKLPQPAPVPIEPDRVNALLGMTLRPTDMKKYLQRLQFRCRPRGKGMAVVPPMHRFDVREEPDVAEEIVRLAGYDRVPVRQKGVRSAAEAPSREERLTESAHQFFIGLGFYEARNYGLISRHQWEAWLAQKSPDAVELMNPLSLSGELLVPSLLPHLIQNAQTNQRHGWQNCRLFETSKTFRRNPRGVHEAKTLGWVACGQTHGNHWLHKPRPLDIWDVKTWMQSWLNSVQAGNIAHQKEKPPDFFHPVEFFSIHLEGQAIGLFGRLHPRRAAELDLPKDTFLGEIDLSRLATSEERRSAYRPLPKYPALVRDFSMIFPDAVAWEALSAHMARHYPHIETLELFDLFQGGSLPAGHKSLAFRITLRHPDHTLTDAEAGELQKSLTRDLRTRFGALLRQAASSPSEKPS